MEIGLAHQCFLKPGWFRAVAGLLWIACFACGCNKLESTAPPAASAVPAAQVPTPPPPRPSSPPNLPEILAYIPTQFEFVAGGRPNALSQSQNQIAPSFREQLKPLNGLLTKIGWNLDDVTNFWGGTSAEEGETLICIVSPKPIDIAAVRTQLGLKEPATKTVPEMLALPETDGYAVTAAGSHVLLCGRPRVLERSLEKPSAGAPRFGLHAMNYAEADFWFACDLKAANEQLKEGFPIFGTFTSPLKNTQGFAIGFGLEPPGTEGPAGIEVVAGIALDNETEADITQKLLDQTCVTKAEKMAARRAAIEKAAANKKAADGADGGKQGATGNPGFGQNKVTSSGNTVVVSVFDPKLRPISPPHSLVKGRTEQKQVAAAQPTANVPAISTSNAAGTAQAPTIPWATRNGSEVQLAYRFDSSNLKLDFESDLLKSIGASAIGNGLFLGSLQNLDQGIRKWEAVPNPAPPVKGVSYLKGNQDNPELGYSWMTHLLPYIGNELLYRKFNFEKKWTSPDNYKLAGTVIPEFLNPADPRATWKGYPIPGIGLTHFAGMSGVEDRRNVVAATLPRSDPRAGVFGYDEIAKPTDITDGQSRTIMLIGNGRLAGPWVQGGGSTIRGAREPYFDNLSGFGSKGLDSPGTYVLFADGSARILSADIDPAVFRALCTIHGGEAVDMPKLESTRKLKARRTASP